MVLGLERRLRERPGPLSWGTVLARWFTANLGSLLSLLPVVALFAWAYSLLDVLWPLWDPKRQAVHDKVARTNVVPFRSGLVSASRANGSTIPSTPAHRKYSPNIVHFSRPGRASGASLNARCARANAAVSGSLRHSALAQPVRCASA